MTGQPKLLSKSVRLALFLDRVSRALPAGNHAEAMALIAENLNAVEDEFSGIPNNPDQPGTDGRMYPPDERFRYGKWERPGVRCYRHVAHVTFVAENGAVEIRSRSGVDLGVTLLDKPGGDGRKVNDYDSAC